MITPEYHAGDDRALAAHRGETKHDERPLPEDITRFRPGPIERKGVDVETTQAATRERVSVVEPPQEWYEARCLGCSWVDTMPGKLPGEPVPRQHGSQPGAEGAATWHAKSAQHRVAVERVTMVGVSEALGS